MICHYRNHTAQLFQGFYESNLYNSDMCYNEEYAYEMPEGYSFDIDNFDKYMEEIGQLAVDTMESQLTFDEIIHGMVFKGISSPKYYNFETDKLNIDIDFDEEKLTKYCFEENLDSFREYLNTYWSSRDGFISFVPNTVEEFKEWDGDKYEIMLEFYLLQNLNLEEYEQDLYDNMTEIFYNHLVLTDDEFNYEYSINEETVIVGNKIED